MREISDAIIAKSSEGRVIYWGNGAQRVFGYSSEEAVGHLVSELIIPPDRLEEEAGILKDVLVSELSQYETTRSHKNGSLIYVDVSSKAVRDGEGKLQFILSTNKDVTQLAVRRDTKLAEARFGNLLESMPDGIIMANSAGRIVLANGQAERLFGYARKELLGEMVESLIPERFRRHYLDHRFDYSRRSKPGFVETGFELYGLRKDGSEFPTEIMLGPVQTEEGTLVVRAIRDITERKSFEKALEEKNLELERAAASKNKFLANMSHELRTPLNGIIGFAEFMVDGKPGSLNPRQKEYLGDILNSGRHLLQLINDILDLSKVEANRMDFHPESFSLVKAIEGVCAVAKPIAQKKHIPIQVSVAADLQEVLLDPQKFKQVLYNLVSNAIKFTDEGGSVAVTAKSLGMDRFSLAVKDTGIGIRKEDFPRLFNEFEQLESGMTRHYEGTGLGLALTKKIVQLQGGSISLESEFGHGTTFTVVLPQKGAST